MGDKIAGSAKHGDYDKEPGHGPQILATRGEAEPYEEREAEEQVGPTAAQHDGPRDVGRKQPGG